jgi:hypothetical protein
MKTKFIYLLLSFIAAIAFEACKTSEKTTDKEKQINITISEKDTLSVNNKTVITGKNDLDTINSLTAKNILVKDTIETEKIPLINPKIHPYTLSDYSKDSNLEEINLQPRYKIIELSNFNPFLEKMYSGVIWKHYDNEFPQERYNVYAAFYKGTEFFYEYVNSFVYYFYDIGEISHADLIKTATFWILQPLYPDVEVYKTELYDQKDMDEHTHYKYYYTTGRINGEKLEIYAIIWNDQIYKFRALKNKVEIKGLGSFI